MSDEIWSLRSQQLFENYDTLRNWCDQEQVLGFVVGNAEKRTISNVLFNPVTEFSSVCDLAQFIESSHSAEVNLVGVVSLTDVTYSFDVRKLSVMTSDVDAFLTLTTDTNTLRDRDVASFMQQNTTIREYSNVNGMHIGVLGRVCHRITLNVRVDDPRTIAQEMSKAFDVESEAVDSLAFVNTEKNVLITSASERAPPDISPLLKGFKKPDFNKDHIEMTPLQPLSSGIAEEIGQRLVPIVKIKNGLSNFLTVKLCVNGYAVLQTDDSAEVILDVLRTALKRALFLYEQCLASCKSTDRPWPEVDSYAFGSGENAICVCYPRIDDGTLLRGYRSKLHRTLNIGCDRPMFRPSQAICVDSASSLLRDPHLHIRNYKPKGEISVVKGHYNYHHYMQDGMDDNGWGCAYRSFQTIWSWLLLQGYTDKPVPTHRQIQQSLHDCGDKQESFVGSRLWIGSMEISYCLDNMLGMQSRLINTNSGAEVADNVRQLIQHFSTSGAPVMIGGGMLAHTILGVDFNDSTGECAFLVLDPHYTGEEDMTTVVSKGWCGWKPPSFWKPDHFYNLILPTPPSNVI